MASDDCYCATCASINVGYILCDKKHHKPASIPIDIASTPIESIWKYKSFHDPCNKCDDLHTPCLVRCCGFCRHLRLPHLVSCCAQQDGDYIITFRKPWRGDMDDTSCEVCAFLYWVPRIVKAGIVSLRLSRDHYMRHSRIISTTGESSGNLWAMTIQQDHLPIAPYINWQWVRRWLHCIESQPQSATYSFPCVSIGYDCEFDFSRQKTRDVRVIDVKDECIVGLCPGSRYVALPYVWGRASSDPFCLSTSNVEELRTPRSLRNVCLPATINDAIAVCRELGHPFLWIDRLCIVQDGSFVNKSVQLDQMAAIYGQAALTIVAAEGNGAEYGLAGVSQPRIDYRAEQFGNAAEYRLVGLTPPPPDNRALRINKNFALVKEVRSYTRVIRETVWADRGWTFQELLASPRLLIFTNHGLFVRYQREGLIDTFSEGATSTYEGPKYEHGMQMHDILSDFTKLSLTYQGDALRAVAGLLHTFYGERVSYGLPWQDFERFILWTPKQTPSTRRQGTEAEPLPTWSWASVLDAVYFLRPSQSPRSLAYWGHTGPDSLMDAGKPSWTPIPLDDGLNTARQGSQELATMAALAWTTGCIRSKPPPWLCADDPACLTPHQTAARWTHPKTYRDDAFAEYSDLEVFNNIDLGISSAFGKIAVHTQHATFFLGDQGEKETLWGTTLLRSSSNSTIAGIIRLDREPVHSTEAMTLIAVSVGDLLSASLEQTVAELSENLEDDSTISWFYGCPCSLEDGTRSDLPHILQCPQHANFWKHALHGEIDKWMHQVNPSEPSTASSQAFNNHLMEVWHLDGHERFTNELSEPPKLHVMLVTPSPVQTGSTILYERLGIGQIYLRSWLEARPRFETMVLA